jgi:hypothetical protein
MGVFLDFQRAMAVVGTFPIAPAVNFFTAMKERRQRQDALESFYHFIIVFLLTLKLVLAVNSLIFRLCLISY